MSSARKSQKLGRRTNILVLAHFAVHTPPPSRFLFNNPVHIRIEKEFEAYIWWFCSTIEYFKTAKYELPTPSQSGDRVDRLISQPGGERPANFAAM